MTTTNPAPAKYPWSARNRWVQLGDTVCITERARDGSVYKLYGALHNLCEYGSVSVWFDGGLPQADGALLQSESVHFEDILNLQPAAGETHRIEIAADYCRDVV
jgi:hypothetical protein